MKNKAIEETKKYLTKEYGEDLTCNIVAKSYTYLAKLMSENESDSKEVRKHTFMKIYPCISMYKAMQDNGIDKADAEKFLDITHSKRAEGKAKAMRGLCKLPGMYKKMPSIFRSVTNKEFGTRQGFCATFYDMGKSRCKFDMTRCLYLDVCTKYNCAELTKCFCHTDDVTDGNIHPKLKWNRTKTMGEGGDVCDFDLYIINENK